MIILLQQLIIILNTYMYLQPNTKKREREGIKNLFIDYNNFLLDNKIKIKFYYYRKILPTDILGSQSCVILLICTFNKH